MDYEFAIQATAFTFLAVVFYFLPSIVANHRNNPRSGQIFFLNLLLGWSGIAWAIAMIWAIGPDRRPAARNWGPPANGVRPAPYAPAQPPPPDYTAPWANCPGCGATLAVTTTNCPNCASELPSDWATRPPRGSRPRAVD